MKTIAAQTVKKLQLPLSSEHNQNQFKNIPETKFFTDQYIVRFAGIQAEVDAALQLRFEVFNLELNEGLDASYISGRDEDKFDAVCLHLRLSGKKNGSGCWNLSCPNI